MVSEFRVFFGKLLTNHEFEGKKEQKSRFSDFFAKIFGKVSSQLRKSFNFHEKYLPLKYFFLNDNLKFFPRKRNIFEILTHCESADAAGLISLAFSMIYSFEDFHYESIIDLTPNPFFVMIYSFI